jgi:2'-5' RNA ligase
MFVAVYPPQEAVDDLDAFLEPRREAGEGAPAARGGFRWSSPDQWHLTLAFLADVPDRAQDELAERLEAAVARRQRMTASIGGGGAYPGAHSAKVLWAGIDVDDGAELDQLAAGCRAAAAKSGSPPSGERFRPHLTVARMGRPIEATRWVRILDSYRGPAWVLAEVALVASHLGEGPRKRPRHDVVETFTLS